MELRDDGCARRRRRVPLLLGSPQRLLRLLYPRGLVSKLLLRSPHLQPERLCPLSLLRHLLLCTRKLGGRKFRVGSRGRGLRLGRGRSPHQPDLITLHCIDRGK